MILAVVLSALVLLGWSFLADKFSRRQSAAAEVEDGQARCRRRSRRPSAGCADTPRRDAQRARGAARRRRGVRIETPRLRGSINLKGARIDDLVLSSDRERLADEFAAGARCSRRRRAGAPISRVRLERRRRQRADRPTRSGQASGTGLRPGRPVTLSWTNPAARRFEILLRSTTITCSPSTSASSTRRRAGRRAALRAGQPRAAVRAILDSWTVHVGPMGVFDGAADYDVDWNDVREAAGRPAIRPADGGWIGFTDKYWLAALAPAGRRSPATLPLRARAAPTRPITSAPAVDRRARPDARAPRRRALRRRQGEGRCSIATRQRGIAKLSKAIDWGWFEWFMRPIFALLNWLFKQIGNFGVAIICLTLIVRG